MPFKHENPIVERVDELLDQWGRWAQKGYRREGPQAPPSILGKIREERDGASHPACAAPVFTQEDIICMQIDSAVTGLPDRKIRRAVVLYYARNLGKEEASTRMHMSVKAYEARLRIGRWILVGSLRHLLEAVAA